MSTNALAQWPGAAKYLNDKPATSFDDPSLVPPQFNALLTWNNPGLLTERAASVQQTNANLEADVRSSMGPPSFYHYPGEAALGVTRGALHTTGAGIAGLGQIAEQELGLDPDVVGLMSKGRALQGLAESIPGTPGLEDSWTRKISEGVGSVFPSAAAFAAGGPIAGAAFGASAAYDGTYRQALQLAEESGLKGDDAKRSARNYARVSSLVTGITEPFGAAARGIKILKRLDDASGKWIGKEILKAGSLEGLQEGFQEIPDEVARRTYVNGRTIFDSIEAVGGAAAIGGVVGLIFGGISSAPAMMNAITRSKRQDVPPPLPPPSTEFVSERSMTPEEEADTRRILDLPPEAKNELIADYDQRVAAGQKDPVVSADKWKAITGEKRGTRREGADKLNLILEERTNAVSQGIESQGGEQKRVGTGEVGQTQATSGRSGFGEGREISQEKGAIDPLLASSLRPVEPSVAAGISKLKIFDSVVGLNSVDMVNVLGGQKRATQMLLHDPTMFLDSLIKFNPNPDVLARWSGELSANADRAALIRAKKSFPAGRIKEFDSAFRALEGNLRVIVRTLSDYGLTLSGANDILPAKVGAAPGTIRNVELPQAARPGIELGATNLANNVRHQAIVPPEAGRGNLVEEGGQGEAQGEVSDVLAPPVGEAAKQAAPIKPPSQAKQPPKKIVEALTRIARKYRDQIAPEVDDSVTELEGSGNIDTLRRPAYSFTQTFAGEAKMLQENLPKRLRRYVRVLKKGHKDYNKARGEEIMQNIGMDAMVDAIKAAHPSRGTTANAVVDFFERDPKMKQLLAADEIRAVVEYQRWRDQVSVQEVKGKQFQPGEEVKIGGDKFYVEREGNKTKLVDDVEIVLDANETVEIDAGTRRLPDEAVQRPGLFQQETFDPLTGKQSELPLAARQESAPPDVPGQETFGDTKEAWADVLSTVDKITKRMSTPFSNQFFDPDLYKLAGELTVKLYRAGKTTLVDLTKAAVQVLGDARAKVFLPMIEDHWNKQFASQTPPPKKPYPPKDRVPGRPDLANPAVMPQARKAVTGVDVARTLGGRPEVRNDVDVFARARQRLSENYAGELERALSGELMGSVDGLDENTIVIRDIIDRESVEALQSGDEARMERAQEIVDSYRDDGSELARAMRQRRDWLMSPEQRAKSHISEALIQPDQKTQKAISRLKKAREKLLRSRKLRSQASQQARVELDDAWKEFTAIVAGRVSANPVDAIASAVKVAKAAIRLGVANFKEFYQHAVDRMGEEAAERNRAVLEQAWQQASVKETEKPASVAKPTRPAKKKVKGVPMPSPELVARPGAAGMQAQIGGGIGEAVRGPTPDAVTTPGAAGDQKTAEFVRDIDEKIAARRKAWARKAKRIYAELEAAGYDITGILEGRGDPLHAAQTLGQIHAKKSDYWDKQYEYWINSILSGPQTNVVNLAGGVYNMLKGGLADRFAGAIVGSGLRGIGLNPDLPRFAELKAYTSGLLNAWGRASANFLMTWRTEVPQFNLQVGKSPTALFEFRRPSIPGRRGRVIRWPTRAIVGADDLVKTLSQAGEATAMAHRVATNEGTQPADLARRMAEIQADPLSEVNQDAADVAIERAFQDEIETIKTVSNVVHKVPGGRYVLPFIPTLTNLLRAGLRQSPLGTAALGRALHNARKTGDWSGIDRRISEQIVAWGVFLALGFLNDPDDPWITGTDDKHHPQSIKILGKWMSYQRMEPLATTLALMVDTLNKIRRGADVIETVKAPFDSLLEQIGEKSFLDGISDIVKAASEADSEHLARWASKFAASWIPNIVRQPAGTLRNDVRQTRIWGKGADRYERMARRALESTNLVDTYPKRDLAGRAVPKDGSPFPNTDIVWRLLSPAQAKNHVPTVIDRMILNWRNAHPSEPDIGLPQPWYTVDGKTIYMTDAEYDRFLAEAGQETVRRVEERQKGRNPFHPDKPTENEIEDLRGIIEGARRKARQAIKSK